MAGGVSHGENLERARDEARAPGRTRMASAPAVLERVLRRPTAALTLLCLLQIALWTLFPSLVSFAPPRDTVESYLWGHEWVAGTYKHPNLPGWALETGRLVTGTIVGSAYLVSQLFVAATYVCVFMLGREMMGASRALAGTLLLTGVYYTTIPSVMMNHNAAMMPFWAAIAWQLWHARTRPGLIAWAALGVLAGLSLYAKLSSGVMLVTAGLWLLYDPALRRQLRSPWPWAGLALFGLLVIPLVTWLHDSGFAALAYAKESANSEDGGLKFIGGQLLAAAGAAAIALFSGLIGWRPSSGATQPASGSGPLDPQAIPFLASMTIGPILLTAAFAMVSGASNKWGAPMLSLCGLLLVAGASHRFDSRVLSRIALAACVLLCVVPPSFALFLFAGPNIARKPIRESWPQAEISERFQRIWRARVGKPLRIVAGSPWEAGLVALRPGPMPSILTNGDMGVSPWITPERMRREGVLVVWPVEGPEPQIELRPLVGTRPIGIERFDYPLCLSRCRSPLLLGYTIIPPE